MANLDMAAFALKSICPNNDILYDSKELPSVMVYIPSFKLKDVLSTNSDDTHNAFVVSGDDISGFYAAKFISHVYGGRPYSNANADPTVNVSADTIAGAARLKGTGYHEITAFEWAALALWCHKNGTEPKGNNSYGKDDSESVYKARPTAKDLNDRILRTATGTGPIEWSHDHTLAGITDLNGNVGELCIGARLVGPELQIIADNDAALNLSDLADDSELWKAIDASDGSLVAPGSSGTVKLDWDGTKWTYDTTVVNGNKGLHSCDFKNVTAESSISSDAVLLLQSLALLPDSSLIGQNIDADYGNDTFNADTDQTERILYRGGAYNNTDGSGVFHVDFTKGRSAYDDAHGGRTAYINT